MAGKEYDGFVVVVTGASTGLGRAIAEEVAARGAAAVVINYASNKAEAEETARRVEGHSAKAVIVQGDVAKDEDCLRIAAAAAPFGRIDALFNNAGTTKFANNHADLDAVSAENFQRIYAVNVVGPFQMVRACRALLEAAQQPGAVVNTSSIAGVTGIGSSVPYAASKGAMITMTLSLARALAPKIRVNAVCPGFIDTPWFGRGMPPRQVERPAPRRRRLHPVAGRLPARGHSGVGGLLRLARLAPRDRRDPAGRRRIAPRPRLDGHALSATALIAFRLRRGPRFRIDSLRRAEPRFQPPRLGDSALNSRPIRQEPFETRARNKCTVTVITVARTVEHASEKRQFICCIAQESAARACVAAAACKFGCWPSAQASDHSGRRDGSKPAAAKRAACQDLAAQNHKGIVNDQLEAVAVRWRSRQRLGLAWRRRRPARARPRPPPRRPRPRRRRARADAAALPVHGPDARPTTQPGHLRRRTARQADGQRRALRPRLGQDQPGVDAFGVRTRTAAADISNAHGDHPEDRRSVPVRRPGRRLFLPDPRLRLHQGHRPAATRPSDTPRSPM